MKTGDDRAQGPTNQGLSSWLGLALLIASVLLLSFRGDIVEEALYREAVEQGGTLSSIILGLTVTGALLGFLGAWRTFWWTISIFSIIGVSGLIVRDFKLIWAALGVVAATLLVGWLVRIGFFGYIPAGPALLARYSWLGISTPSIYLSI